METTTKLAVNRIVNLLKRTNAGSFIGIKNYTSKTTGEISNHIINLFDYSKAVERDVKILKEITFEQINEIAQNGSYPVELVQLAVNNVLTSLIKNQNDDTKSNQSLGQELAYVNICKGLKLCLETGMLHIYGMAISKQVLIQGVYKEVNSRPLTKAQNSVKKYLNLTTSKFRNFIINPENLASVNMQGEKITLL